MRKIAVAGLCLLAAACASEEETRIEYGPPLPASYDEQLAVENAEVTLSAAVAYEPTTEPAYGAPGLADQLAAELGGLTTSAAAPDSAASALRRSALAGSSRTALTAVDMDPACVDDSSGTSVTWTGCEVTMTDVDPYTGDTMDMTITVNGSMSWNVATGVTTWDVVETVDMALTQDGQTMTMEATAHPTGTMTVTASRIAGHAESSVSATVRYMGMTIPESFRTSLDLDVEYETPFCITGGTLALEQVWTRRPPGATDADLPNQGWRFEWTGCGEFTVAHGS